MRGRAESRGTDGESGALLGFILSTGTTLAAFLAGLAPSVTFEDSGELIAAAYVWGIPHEPGYPLYTLLAKGFTLLPFGTVAYRVNLLSAVCSALAAGFVFLSLLSLLSLDGRDATDGRVRRLTWISALCGAVLVGASPTLYSQAVITEVYGLNNLFFALLLWMLISWARSRDRRWFYRTCLVFGLALSNHHTVLVFGPLVLATWVTLERGWTGPNAGGRRLLHQATVGLVFVALGLLPYLYLPLVSSRQPLIDWGNPETWSRFWNVVTRAQYGLPVADARSAGLLVAQIGLQVELLAEQYPLILLAAAIWGLVGVARLPGPYGLIVVGYLLLTGPAMAYVTNANALAADPLVYQEERGATAVWNLPLYIMTAMLIGYGVGHQARRWARQPGRAIRATALAVAFVALTVWVSVRTVRAEGQRHARYASQYVSNIFSLTGPRALVLGNWDPFVFPLMYAQAVERQQPDVVVLDTELMRLSWYIESMRRWYPVFLERARPEIDAFLRAVAPLEAGEPFDFQSIHARYLAMMHAIVDAGVSVGDVYLTFHPRIRPIEEGLVADYQLESCLVAFRVRRPEEQGASDCGTHAYEFTGLLETSESGPRRLDRMAEMIRGYYALLHRVRAATIEQVLPARAIELYRQSMALEGDAVMRERLRAQVGELERITK